jgi:maltooligosyltrehalose trehalohydrolase
MHVFRVWAPGARTVDLVLPPGRSHPMQRRPDGWWTVEVADAGHGTDYAFRLDGGQPRPDPRSPRQPFGVHGPSQVFDAGRYGWTNRDWPGRELGGAVFYELHIGTFTPAGTFDAAARHLDHLVDLGVDVVEVMPVAAFDGERGWGYDGVDLYAVHEPYGGPQAFQRFVDACHGVGLAVCLDVVYNHLGPSGNYLSGFGPYFSDQHETPWGAGVNLDDAGRAQVRRWICDNALRWFEDFHVDALRLDAVDRLVDESGRHLLAQLSDETSALSLHLDRPLSLVAESALNDPRMVDPTIAGGLGMTAQWSDDFHHAVHAWLTGEKHGYYADFGDVDTVAHTLTAVFHRSPGSLPAAKDWPGDDPVPPVDPDRHRGHQFLVCLQNHDQVGNRAAGERIAGAQLGRAAAGAALVLTSPFTPLLFMGEEWAASTPWQYFTDFDPALGTLVREGRRREFAEHGWDAVEVPDPQDPGTRDRSVLRWDEPGAGRHATMLAWYRALIALRRAEPDLRDDDLAAVRVTTGPDWLVLHRGGLDVLVNLGAQHAALPVAPGSEVLLAWPGAPAPQPGPGGLLIAPDSAAVVRSPPAGVTRR